MEKIDVDSLEKFLTTNSIVVILFVSDAVPQCNQLIELTKDLAKQDQFAKVKFVTFDIAASEAASSLAQQFAVTSVPTTIIFNLANEVDRMVGADPGQLVAKVENVTETYMRFEERLEKLINAAPIMIFMKGTPSQPRCGYSRTLLTLLQEYKIDYEHFDILEDEEVRQGLKLRSNWPTYPQIFVKGQFIGGIDIIKELHENGELADAFKG